MFDGARAFRPLQLLFLICGLGFLGIILWNTDLQSVAQYVSAIGWGILLVLAVYMLAFLADTASWQTVIRNEWLKGLGFYALWKIRMVGAALNRVTPVFGLAGEPVKAILLRKFHGMDYQEGAASLVVAKTANLIALVIFLAIGLATALTFDLLPKGYNWGAVAALTTLTLGILALFLVQRLKLSSATASWLSQRRFGRPIAKVIEQIHALDQRLVESYTRDRRRFALSVLLTLVNWLLGAVELWVTLWFIGEPITLVEALCADAAVELVRAATFFIPATIGTQEAALVLVLGHITGQPSVGLAVAVIRRFREIIWVVWGFAIGWFGFRPQNVS